MALFLKINAVLFQLYSQTCTNRCIPSAANFQSILSCFNPYRTAMSSQPQQQPLLARPNRQNNLWPHDQLFEGWMTLSSG